MASALDVAVILAYGAFVLWLGFRASRGQRLEGFLVNQRRTGPLLLTLSNTATLVGAGAVVGVASAAYSSGISYGISVLFAFALGMALLALVAPRIKAFGDRFQAHTLGDFFEHRFGPRFRSLSAVLLVLLMLAFGAVQLSAMAQLMKALFGLEFALAVLAAVLVTILYTSLGGLRSDLLTDYWQFWVMALTFVLLLPSAWLKSGGLPALQALPASHFDPLAFGGVAFLFGGMLLGGLILLSNVNFWQRIYSADSVGTARKSFWYAVPLAALFVAGAALAGLFAAVLLPGASPDTSLFLLMDGLLPPGLLGLAYAGILAVAMSTVDSLLLGGSATVLKDLYLPLFRPALRPEELLKKARYLTVLFGVASAAAAFLFPDIVLLSIFAASLSLCFVPPLLGGLFWRRTTPAAATLSLLGSLAVLLAATPVAPKVAFLPSFLTGLALLVVVSFLTRPAKGGLPLA